MKTGGGRDGRTRRAGAGERAIEAGLSLINERGFDALTLKQVAAATGLGPPALHWYFKDRLALLGAVAVRSLRDVQTSLVDGPATDQLDALVADALVHLPPAAAICVALGRGPMTQWEGAEPIVTALAATIERFGGSQRSHEIALVGVLALLVGAASGLIGRGGDDLLRRTTTDVQTAVRALVVGVCTPSDQADPQSAH